jgi:hypothetical protein
MTQTTNVMLAIPLIVGLALSGCSMTKRVSYTPTVAASVDASACVRECRRGLSHSDRGFMKQCMLACPGMVRSEGSCQETQADAQICVEDLESEFSIRVAANWILDLGVGLALPLVAIAGVAMEGDS